MYRDLLVQLHPGEEWPAHVACAVTLAARYRAFIDAIVIGDMESDQAVNRFQTERLKRGVRGNVERLSGRPDAVLALCARFHDLVVVSRSSSGLPPPEAAVLSGRPTLFIQPNYKHHSTFDRVLLAWNGSVEATRALHAALPFIEASKTVFLLAGASAGTTEGATLSHADARFAAYLNRRARSVSVVNSAVENDRAADTIVQAALDHSCDLIVMGAHAEEKPEGLKLGGATAAVFAQSTAPILAAH